MALYRYKNSKVYWMDFVFDGVRVRESTKSRTKKLAEEIERKRRDDLERGRMGIRKRERPRTLTLAAEDYLIMKRPVLSDRGLIIESANLKHVLPVLGGRLLSDIDARLVSEYQDLRLDAGASPKTINLEIGTLRAILLRHGTWGFIRKDIRMLKVDESPGRCLTAEEEGQLLNECSSSRSRPLYTAVVLALSTGMRSIEIRLLKWKQISLQDGTIRVGRSKTDAGAGRIIPLNQRAHAVLSYWASQFEQCQPEDFCFPSERYGQNGAPYQIDVTKPTGSFKEAWEGARKRAAIRCRFHDLRHTACTRLLEGGVPFSVLAQIMGWSASATVAMAKRYGHIGDASLRQAMAVLDRPARVGSQLQERRSPGILVTEKSPD